MPQMAPLSWTLIFCLSLSTLLVSCVKLFFVPQVTETYTLSHAVKISSQEPQMSWKW